MDSRDVVFVRAVVVGFATGGVVIVVFYEDIFIVVMVVVDADVALPCTHSDK